MKSLSKDTKEILTLLAAWASFYGILICAFAVMAQTFNLGIAYVFLLIISGFLATAILPKD